MIVVLGSPGTGKTALLRDLATTFRERGRSACLLDFGDSPFDVGPAEIVLVDETDRMSATRLDELRSRGDLAIVLAALPASEQRFASYPDVTIVRLSPLSPDRARAFLVERLAQLGLPRGCLTEAAWKQLIAYGRGVPRLLLSLLGLALFLAGEEKAERVTHAHVEQAVEATGGSTEASTGEPDRTGATPTKGNITETKFEGSTSAETALDWISKAPRSRWPTRMAVTAFAAGYLAVVATLLIWGHAHLNETTASGPSASNVTQASPGHTLVQEASDTHGVSNAPPPAVVPTPILAPEIATPSVQPAPELSASAGSFQEQPTVTSRVPAVAAATQPFGAHVSALAWAAEHPRRCPDGTWTWNTCRAHPRPVVWHRVRRCFIALGNLCIGPSYHYVRVGRTPETRPRDTSPTGFARYPRPID
jgi:hypothetical protein